MQIILNSSRASDFFFIKSQWYLDIVFFVDSAHLFCGFCAPRRESSYTSSIRLKASYTSSLSPQVKVERERSCGSEIVRDWVFLTIMKFQKEKVKTHPLILLKFFILYFLRERECF